MFASEHPGSCKASGIHFYRQFDRGCINSQALIGTSAKVTFTKRYDQKTAIIAADLLNDQRAVVLREAEDGHVPASGVTRRSKRRILRQPGATRLRAYLAFGESNHSRHFATKNPQTNDICVRFHKSALNESYQVVFREKVYRSLDEM